MITLVRGLANDKPYAAEAASGGTSFLLPNTIRYQRRKWDERLERINGYFSEATTKLGGDGRARHELERIIEHHAGGGLGKASTTVRSVLISTSTKPLGQFGPPFFVLRVPASRAIFNYRGVDNESEVLLPFWVLPHEIVGEYEDLAAVENDPHVKSSLHMKLDTASPTFVGNDTSTDGSTWKTIEENIRNGRPSLDGLLGVNCRLDRGLPAGPDADRAYVERFVTKLASRGAKVERVPAEDARLQGALARTYLGADGKPRVLIPEGAVKKVALAEELAHVIQLERALLRVGEGAVEKLLLRAAAGEADAIAAVEKWEVEAKRVVRVLIDKDDPLHETVDRSLVEHARLASGLPTPPRPDSIRELSRLPSTLSARDLAARERAFSRPETRGILDRLDRARATRDRAR